jgi:hypothetical protein
VVTKAGSGTLSLDSVSSAYAGLSGNIFAGQTTVNEGTLKLGANNALTVPQTALVVRDGFSYVMRLGDGDRVSALKVQVGRMVGDRVEVTGGLDANARIVASGGSFLSDGDLVRVAAAAAPAASKAASK